MKEFQKENFVSKFPTLDLGFPSKANINKTCFIGDSEEIVTNLQNFINKVTKEITTFLKFDYFPFEFLYH